MKNAMIRLAAALTCLVAAAGLVPAANAQGEKPNILVIMGDDVGITNISAYSHGLMGYETPNIDRLAEEGAMFTDYYGEQSCTAGRSAFITGQSPFRVGLTKVGMPGAKQGISDEDPTLAQLLKPRGYTSGQFGKNHLGDRNEYLPTVHGFDEYAALSRTEVGKLIASGDPAKGDRAFHIMMGAGYKGGYGWEKIYDVALSDGRKPDPKLVSKARYYPGLRKEVP